METFRILVTGCPRSGTHYAERQLRDSGMLVRHERMGVHGTVSSIMCVEDFYYLSDRPLVPRLSTCKFENVVHLVRNPLDCIPSMAINLPVRFWRWQEKHTEIPGDLDPAILRASMFWVVWNEIVEDRFPEAIRIRIEDWYHEWPSLAGKLGIEQRPILDTRPSKTEHERLKLTEIGDEPLRMEIIERSKRYGYEVE